MNKSKIIQQEEYTKKIIRIKNLYTSNEIIKDIQEQFKLFGEETFKGHGIYLKHRTTAGKVAYLPNCRFKIWKRHLVMSLNYLSEAREKKGFKEYMDKRFGNNWFSQDGDGWKIRIILVKNILDKPVSTKNNNWKCIGSIWKNEIVLEKMPEIDFQAPSNTTEQDFGDGLFLTEVKNE